MTTKEMIAGWLAQGVKQKSTHVIVVCDTFDHEDYPVYVNACADFERVFREYNDSNMQRIMEVYDLAMDLQKQLAEVRAYHPPAGFTATRRTHA